MSDTTISTYSSRISGDLDISAQQVEATLKLLDEGGTIPFIARYRKENTGSLDEVAITAIRDSWEKLQEFDARRDVILKSLQERDLLTAELKAAVYNAVIMSELEDVYLPYRPKRRTRATIAIEKGLEPLATTLVEMKANNPVAEAANYISAEKDVATAEDALAGARDIIAERFSDDAGIRAQLRTLFNREAVVTSKVAKGKADDGEKFKDYFEWSELASKTPSHRLLAMLRGENEKMLNLKILPPEEDGLRVMERFCVNGQGACADQIREAAYDAYKRLISRSLETELRQTLKLKADEKAIQVFVENLRELLLSSPLGRKRVLGLDPAFRTGCKTVCLDEQGKLLSHTVIYPHSGAGQRDAAGKEVVALCSKFAIEAIAIGNGTASRESEDFVKGLGLPKEIQVIMVNESGASIYSASDVARNEFPDLDLTVRSAVSIGRRLMDPLAELVKIDPKSIGVGQYQHDVDQKLLRKSLDDTVISCVNHVGVEVNTASKELLSYVAGLNATTAGNIIAYREENGPFTTRKGLLKVPRLGPKAFEQAAGFMRVRGGKNPLDASAVHPERYCIVDEMAKSVGCKVKDLIEKPELRDTINLSDFVSETCGLPTLSDIVSELAKPGRDPREQFEAFSFSDDVHDMNDLKQGMQLPGVVTNVTAFGAFVDVGVHQDGLVHISQLADCYVKDPADIVKVHQKVIVTVMEVDVARKRIGLSMKKDPFAEPPRGGGRPDNRNQRGESGGNRNPRTQQRPRQQSPSITNDWFSQGVKKGKR